MNAYFSITDKDAKISRRCLDKAENMPNDQSPGDKAIAVAIQSHRSEK